MEALNGLLNRAKDLKLIQGFGVRRDSLNIEISHLFFADDTLIFCHSEIKNLQHLRYLLLYFQGASGLKINLQKMELVRIGADVMECKEVSLPIKYLGMPLGTKYKDKSI